MNKGIFGFPRNAALEAKSVTAQTVTATSITGQTVTAGSRINVPGSSSSDTGIKLINDADLGTLFRPSSYVAVQTVSASTGGPGNCGSLSASISGSHLSVSLTNNCNCDCSTCP